MQPRLQDAEAVVVGEGEALECVTWPDRGGHKRKNRALGHAGADKVPWQPTELADQLLAGTPVHPPLIDLVGVGRLAIVLLSSTFLKIRQYLLPQPVEGAAELLCRQQVTVSKVDDVT